MDVVEDGSVSPESVDENLADLPISEDQMLSKNRSKRKPSKTQIKHIAQSAIDASGVNGQTQRDISDAKSHLANAQNPSAERRKMTNSSNPHHNATLKPEKCDTTSKYGAHNIDDLFNDVTQGIYRDSTTIQQQQSTKIPRRSTKSPKFQQNTPPASMSRSPSGRPAPCYPCGICGKVFRVPSRYDSHMLGHSKGKPFCCNTCGKMFASQEKLDRHLPVHNCDRHAAFTCETCGKVCVNWRAYLYHIKAKHTESGGKRFSCNVKVTKPLSAQKSDRNASHTCESCGKVCVNWRAYVYHQRSRHSESAGKKFTCSLCCRQFYTRHRLRNHTLSHEKGKHHCCHICGKLFESSKKLNIHSLVHNLSSMHDQNLQCIDCGRTYTDWVPFKQHMKTHGAEGVCYPCGLCEDTFPTQYEMEKHKRVHKQFQCEFCDRFFRSASVLSVHLRVHTGERPYKCGLCERDFSQSSVLKVHMRTHAKEGRYECKLCGRVFLDVMEYYRHHMAHLEEGNLQCEECGKIFDNINNKNRHMAAHRDRSGRQCHVCGKEFGRVSHLEAHMLCHSDQVSLMCKVCGKTFSSQELLTAHYSTHMMGDISSDAALSAEGPLFCGICGKMFKDREYLTKHLKKHEKEVQKSNNIDKTVDEDVTEVENGQFSCGDCGKTFGKAHHLSVHRRQHTGECPHSCCMCGQNFMLRTQLLQHIREHRRSGVMMYLNLNAGEVCTTTNDVKNILKLEQFPLASSDTSTETETDHEDNTFGKSKAISSSSHSEQLHQHQAESPFGEKSPEQYHGPSQYHHQHQSLQQYQLPQQHRSPIPSNHTPPKSVSFSADNHSASTINHHPLSSISNEKQNLASPAHHSFRQPFSEAISPQVSSTHAYSISNNNNNNMTLIKESNYLYAKDVPTSCNDLDLIPSRMQFPVPVKNNNNLPITNMRMLGPEPHTPVVAMHMSTNQDLKSDANHHNIPLSYARAYVAPPSMGNVPSHRPPIPSSVHGQSGRFHPDIHHTLPNLQLLPQTAFPDSSHH